MKNSDRESFSPHEYMNGLLMKFLGFSLSLRCNGRETQEASGMQTCCEPAAVRTPTIRSSASLRAPRTSPLSMDSLHIIIAECVVHFGFEVLFVLPLSFFLFVCYHSMPTDVIFKGILTMSSPAFKFLLTLRCQSCCCMALKFMLSSPSLLAPSVRLVILYRL